MKETETDKAWIRSQLREQLRLLAAPGAEALLHYPDGCAKADELALDFDHFYRAFLSHYSDEISLEVQDALRSIDVALSKMSGPAHAEMWTDEAVSVHPAWAEVRRLASLALATVDKGANY